MIRILTGEEFYLRDHYIKKLMTDEEGDLTCTRHATFGEAEETMYYQIPILSNKKSMIVMLPEYGKNPYIDNVLKNPCESTDLYFVFETMDKRSSFYKDALKKKWIDEFNKVDDKVLRTFVLSIIKKANRSITEETFHLLLERINYKKRPFCTLYTVENFVLQCVFSDESAISKESIEIVPKCIDENSFALASHLFKNEAEELFELIDNLFSEKEDPIMLLSLLLYNFRLSYKWSLLEEGLLPATVASVLGITTYQLNSCRKLPQGVSSFCMTTIQDAVNKIKRGGNGKYMLRITVLRLLHIIQEGNVA